MAKRQAAHKHNETSLYLSVIKPVLDRNDLAEYAKVSSTAVDRWYSGKFHPTLSHVRALGELAAVIITLQSELSFEDQDTRTYLRSISLDQDTYEARSRLEQIKDGNTSLVIQDAIELSIEESA